MVRTTDLENDEYEDKVKYISKECYNFLAKSKVYGGDLFINKIGSPGRTYIMPHLNKPVSLGMNLFMVRLKRDTIFNNYFIWAYFNTSIGKQIIQRKINGTVPLTIDKNAIKSLYVPVIIPIIQDKIQFCVMLANNLSEQSKERFKTALSVLATKLLLNKWTPSNDFYSSQSYREVQSYNRWDAEYYQPKYTELFAQIDKINLVPLHKIVTIQKSIEPGSDMYENKGVPFMRVSDMSKYGLSKPNIYLDAHIFKDVIRPKKDTILLSKDGSVGIAYKVQEDLDVITSGAILHLSIFNDDFLPDYVTLVLNSIVGQMQAERDAGGSVIQHWKSSEIENVLIPKLDKKIQQEISQLVQESFKLRAESKRLLEVAKRTVEIAIEEDEEKAIQYINEYGKSLYDK